MRNSIVVGGWLVLVFVVILWIPTLGTEGHGEMFEGERVGKLTLVAPPGPMAIPMAYLFVHERLSQVADEVEFYLWENPDQLRAIVAGSQADFLTLPSNSAAVFFNRGFGVQLLNISVWNILYVISEDPTISSFADLAGRELVVPFQGSMPDLLYQLVASSHGLNPFTDIELQYAANPQQAAQLILSGRVTTAALTEPIATTVLLQTMDTERPLHRVIEFGKELDQMGETGLRSAIAGTVSLASMQGRSDISEFFSAEYERAVAWMLENPEEAGRMAEHELPELGFKAGPVAESLKHIEWVYTPALEARTEIERFFSALMDLSPEVIGGGLPNDGFYFGADR